MDKNQLVLSWSGGKDSSLALYRLLNEKKYEVRYLLTTVTRDFDRISMHGVRKELLLEQAKRVSVEPDIAYISKGASNKEYERVMREKIGKYLDEGIRTIAFGDLFLEDIRKYREDRMAGTGMTCIFPLWKENTLDLARYFIKSGFRNALAFATTDSIFSLFHTFVYDGPIFSAPIPVKKGETVLRDNFYFADILPN